VTERTGHAATRLLLVHWHPVVRRGLAAWLAHLPDMELVGTASTCEQALDTAAALHVELVLMGYSTPDMGGIEATRRLIEAHPATRVVLIGAFDGEARRTESLQSGAVAFAYLGLPQSDMATLLRRAVRGGDPETAH